MHDISDRSINWINLKEFELEEPNQEYEEDEDEDGKKLVRSLGKEI